MTTKTGICVSDLGYDDLELLAKEAFEKAELASPGPWLVQSGCIYALQHHGWHKGKETFENRFFAGLQGKMSEDEMIGTAEFIAYTRTYVPLLADAVLALVARVRELEGSR